MNTGLDTCSNQSKLTDYRNIFAVQIVQSVHVYYFKSLEYTQCTLDGKLLLIAQSLCTKERYLPYKLYSICTLFLSLCAPAIKILPYKLYSICTLFQGGRVRNLHNVHRTRRPLQTSHNCQIQWKETPR